MTVTTRDVSAFEPLARERREAVQLVRRIQALFLELEELRRREEGTPELHAMVSRNDALEAARVQGRRLPPRSRFQEKVRPSS